MFTQMVIYRYALALQLGLQYLSDGGAQPPQAVAALVHFSERRSGVEPSAIAEQISALDTLLHEQMVALSGSRSTPLPPALAVA